MLINQLTAEHIGRQVTLPTLDALGRCRRGTLHSIRNTGAGLTTLQIGDHLHTLPGTAVITVTQEVSGL